MDERLLRVGSKFSRLSGVARLEPPKARVIFLPWKLIGGSLVQDHSKYDYPYNSPFQEPAYRETAL